MKKISVWYIFFGNLSLNQGPTTHFSEIMNGLTKAGVNVTGYAPALGRYQGPYKDKIKIIYTWTLNIPMLRVVIYDFILMVRLLLIFPKPDIFYVRVAYFTLFTPLIAKLFGKKLVLEINGNVVYDVISKGWRGPRKFIPIWCEGFLHRIAAKSICVSETIVKALLEYYKLPAQKLIVLNNGVNVDHFKPIPKEECLQALGLDPAKIYIGYVGCFTGWDGIEHIIHILPELLKKNPNIQVLLVGDGEHKCFVEKEVLKIGVSSAVTFTGFVPYSKLPLYLNSFSIAVAPYGGTKEIIERNVNGGLSSLKCLEYSACALPLIVARIASIEYVEQNKCGIIIEQGDADALLQNVVALLDNPTQALKYGQNGRRYVETNRSWQSVAEKTLNIFGEIVNS